MAGGLVIALPLYYWRLHNTEITEEDFVEPKEIGHSTEGTTVDEGEKEVDAITSISKR